MEFPNKYQWWRFLKAPRQVLTKKEIITFFLFLFFALTSFIFLSASLYFKNTRVEPARGGTYIEGMVGFPHRINPVYAQENDVDRDLAEIIYSGLMKYDEKGELIFDLAKEYKIIDQGQIFEFYLKENLFWSDGAPLTAGDIVFTVKAIQNSALKSPIRASWIGVEVEKISDSAVRFELKNPSAVFLENSTLKIMPEHVWKNVSEQNFPFSDYNLTPIGSGPYKIKEAKQNKENNIVSLELEPNPNYHKSKPYLSRIIFFFFKGEDEMISAFNSGQINAFSLSSFEKIQNFEKSNLFSYQFLMPRYFAVFLNPENAKVLEDKKIRQALNYGTNKEKIVNQALFGQGKAISSPIFSDLYNLKSSSQAYEFDPEKSNQLFEESGFFKNDSSFREKTIKKEPSFQFKSDLQTGSKGVEVEELQKCLAKDSSIYPEGEITGYFGEKTKTAVINFQEKYKSEILTPHGLTSGSGRVLESTRKKLNEICAPVSEEFFSLSFTLTTVDQPTLKRAALILKNDWESLGIKIEIKEVSVSEIREKIRLRNYEMILFGQILGSTPDLFPFWHSSQTRDPGLNLAFYENKEADKLLEEIRQTLDKEERNILLEKFQDILLQDAPAIFLYSPDYIYLVSKEIKGISNKIIIDPSKRFSDIANWYLRTKRTWK